MKLDLFSERYAATGNLASEGARNQLGRPQLDPIAVLVREATQNCWDAHFPEDPHVRISFDLLTVDSELRAVLREQVFADPAPKTDMAKRLRDTATPMTMLMISDRNTSGLEGPTRADVLPDRTDEHTDFVDFLRNIGQPPDRALGGGTFGYGKAALYQMSGLRTILVDTQCRHRGSLERRFIGACLGVGFERRNGADAGRYTGRHWWGRLASKADIADPLLDEEAAAIAKALRFPGFASKERGTTIAIPDFGTGLDRKPATQLQLLVEALLWNFWPKMLPGADGKPAITFSVTFDGETIEVPDPRTWPPLHGFCSAMEALKEVRSGGKKTPSDLTAHVQEIRSKSPKKLLGHAAFVRVPRRSWPTSAEPDAKLGRINTERCHHVAWMRDAELVVKYEPGPPPPGDLLDWAGVFVVSRDADRAFAKSEPPTHDDWVSANLSSRNEKIFVNAGIRNVQSMMKELVLPKANDNGNGSSVPLGALARNLGALLTGHVGRGGDRPDVSERRTKKRGPRLVQPNPEEQVESPPPHPSTKTTSSKAGTAASRTLDPKLPAPPGRPRIRMKEPLLRVRDDVGCLVVPFTLSHGVRSEESALEAELRVEIDGQASEVDPPAGADMPVVLFWKSPTGEEVGQDLNPLVTQQEGDWQVWVTLIDEAPVRVQIRGRASEASP